MNLYWSRRKSGPFHFLSFSPFLRDFPCSRSLPPLRVAFPMENHLKVLNNTAWKNKSINSVLKRLKTTLKNKTKKKPNQTNFPVPWPRCLCSLTKQSTIYERRKLTKALLSVVKMAFNDSKILASFLSADAFYLLLFYSSCICGIRVFFSSQLKSCFADLCGRCTGLGQGLTWLSPKSILSISQLLSQTAVPSRLYSLQAKRNLLRAEQSASCGSHWEKCNA